MKDENHANLSESSTLNGKTSLNANDTLQSNGQPLANNVNYKRTDRGLNQKPMLLSPTKMDVEAHLDARLENWQTQDQEHNVEENKKKGFQRFGRKKSTKRRVRSNARSSTSNVSKSSAEHISRHATLASALSVPMSNNAASSHKNKDLHINAVSTPRHDKQHRRFGSGLVKGLTSKQKNYKTSQDHIDSQDSILIDNLGITILASSSLKKDSFDPSQVQLQSKYHHITSKSPEQGFGISKKTSSSLLSQLKRLSNSPVSRLASRSPRFKSKFKSPVIDVVERQGGDDNNIDTVADDFVSSLSTQNQNGAVSISRVTDTGAMRNNPKYDLKKLRVDLHNVESKSKRLKSKISPQAVRSIPSHANKSNVPRIGHVAREISKAYKFATATGHNLLSPKRSQSKEVSYPHGFNVSLIELVN